MTILYQIFAGFNTCDGDCSPATVARNRDKLLFICDTNLQNYTLQDVTGRWKGGTEKSAIVTFIGVRDHAQLIRNVAGMYKDAANQECVLITETAINVDFV